MISFLADFSAFRANMGVQDFGLPMSSITSTLAPSTPNRRRRVRHKIQTPAYASFAADPKGAMLDLHEIVDISEEGIAIQCHTPLEVETRLNLCLDLADCPEHIYTTGQVIWADPSGRAGLRFADLPSDSLSRLREWLFVNVMAGVANSEGGYLNQRIARGQRPPPQLHRCACRPLPPFNGKSRLSAPNLSGALQLIAERALSFGPSIRSRHRACRKRSGLHGLPGECRQ